MISAACKSCSGCFSSLNSTCSSSSTSTGSSTRSSTCSSSSAGQAHSSHRFRISLAQSGTRVLTMIFTKRSTSCFGRKEHDEHFQRSGQHAEVYDDHRIVDPMLQTPLEKTCRQKRFERSANVFEVAPNRACTNRFALSRRCPASHAEI